MKNKDEMLFANDIPTASTHGKMVAKLVCETANLKKRINDLLKENTEWKLENNRLNNIINRIDNFVDRTIEVIKQQPSDNDEWILERLNGIKYLKELKENK